MTDVRRMRTSRTGEFLAIRSTGANATYVQSLSECEAVVLRPDDRVVDIGAFVGQYSVRCARVPVTSVTAYEPTPINYAILVRNLAAYPHARAVHAAVVRSQMGSARLYISRGNGTRNRLNPIRGGTYVHVPTVSYHEVIAGATVIKIDVEGAEWSYPIVEYLVSSLRALIIEFHPRHSRHASQARAVIEGLENAGFRQVYPESQRQFWVRFVKNGHWGAHIALERT